jgi:4-coumarate--CoA ligase (photoactive yellow protein activation family)
MAFPLPRAALARVVEAKLRAEIAAAAGQHRAGQPPRPLPAGPWPETLSVAEEAPAPTLGCDSLERLWLAGALAEMFHLDASAQGLTQAPTLGAWLDLVDAAASGEAVTFLTSGSSGRPKPCEHRLADLALEIDALAELFAGTRRVVTAVPAHHIYGFLFTALLPARLDVPVAAYGADALRAGDLVVSFPDHWRLVARSHAAFPPGVTGVASTAPCPPDLAADLVARGLSGFVEVYGSSETAGLGTRRHPERAYVLMPHWSFGAEAEPGVPAIVGADGRAVTAMDRLERVGERGFVVAGRRDGMVQVGGINVDPAAVAARLREHPLVADAAVRLMRPEEGARLKAFVVPAAGADRAALATELDAWIRASLPPPQRPAALAFGPALPVNAIGKAADWPAGGEAS